MSQSRFQPVLLAGLTLGVLSSLPIVSAGNCCCGLWFVTAGILAAWLTQQNQPGPLTVGDGALAGLGTGLVGTFVWAILYVPIQSVAGVWQRQLAQGLLDSSADLPPNLRELLESTQGSSRLLFGLVFGFAFMLIVGVVFSTLGGLLGGLLFRKDAPPLPDALGPPPLVPPPFVPPGPPPPPPPAL